MKQKNPRGLFDEEYRLEKLTKKKDPLVRLKEEINWKLFRPILDKVFAKEPKGKVCRKSKMITKYEVIDASVHDSQAIEQLLDKSDSHHELYADSAYSGDPIKETLNKKKIRNRIHEKGYRKKSLTERQKDMNRKKSKIRARVEHIFGFMTNSMKDIFIRTIGKVRARATIGLMNLTYNMSRYLQLRRVKYAQ